MVKKTANKNPSFTLKRLMDLRPCNDGLSQALQLLRKSKAVHGGDAKFWQSVIELFDGSDEDHHRRELRKRQNRVRIEVKPRVFFDVVKRDDEFYEYTSQLLNRRGDSLWKRRLYDRLKDRFADLEDQKVKEDIDHLKNEIKRYEEAVKHHQAMIERVKGELKEREEASKKGPKIIARAEFYPEDYVRHHDDSIREAALEEMVKALHETLPR